jgi:hypothetical protein
VGDSFASNAGYALGVVVGLAAIVGLLWWLTGLSRKRPRAVPKQNPPSPSAPAEQQPQGPSS